MTKKDDGLLLICHESEESFLPWWWLHYHFFHSFPVTFVDAGMSEAGRKWCARRGDVISIPSSESFKASKEAVKPELVLKWTKIAGETFWKHRLQSFAKPLALIHSPYHRTLYMHITCQIQSPIEELFAYCENDSGFALPPEPQVVHNLNLEHHLNLPGEPSYGTGILVYKRSSPLLKEWVEKVKQEHAEHVTEHHLLSKIIFQHKSAVKEIDQTVFWSSFLGPSPRAVVYDWVGEKGKEEIKNQIHIMTQSLLMDLSLE